MWTARLSHGSRARKNESVALEGTPTAWLLQDLLGKQVGISVRIWAAHLGRTCIPLPGSGMLPPPGARLLLPPLVSRVGEHVRRLLEPWHGRADFATAPRGIVGCWRLFLGNDLHLCLWASVQTCGEHLGTAVRYPDSKKSRDIPGNSEPTGDRSDLT